MFLLFGRCWYHRLMFSRVLTNFLFHRVFVCRLALTSSLIQLARDVGVHLPRVFQEPFHVVVHVVPDDARHDLRNSLRLDEVFPAYPTHVGDDTRGQKRGKVGVVLVHGNLRDVLGGATPGGFQGFEVTQEAFFFVDADLELSNVVRQLQGVRVQN